MRAQYVPLKGVDLPGNRLYRVEIHDDGEVFGAPADRGGWIDVTADPRDAATIHAAGRRGVDPSLWRVGRWVEISGRASPLLTTVARVDAKAHTLTLADPVSAGAGRLRLRRIASYKWSRNNGLDALPVRPSATSTPLPATPTVSLVEPVGRRGVRLRVGQWVEVAGDREIRRGDPAPFGKIDDVSYDGYTITLHDPLPEGAGQGSHPIVRRWDAAPDAGAYPVKPATAGWADLESGIQVELTGSGPYRAGHHWLVPARAQGNSIDWPRDDRVPLPRAPLGDHRFARLAVVRIEHDGIRIEDLRSTFVPLADLRAPGAELRGPVTIRGALHVTGSVIIDEEARAHRLAGALPHGAVETPNLAEHAVTAPKLAPHAVEPRHLAEGLGFVPEGFAILGGSPVPPPGFAYTHRQIEVKNPAPAWKAAPPLPGAGGRAVLVTAGEALYALCDHDLGIYRHDEAGARWVEVGRRSAGRRCFGAAAAGHRIHIVGGLDDDGLARADHEIFDTEGRGVAKPAGGLLGRARARLGVAAVGDLVFAVGGVEGRLPWRRAGLPHRPRAPALAVPPAARAATPSRSTTPTGAAGCLCHRCRRPAATSASASSTTGSTWSAGVAAVSSAAPTSCASTRSSHAPPGGAEDDAGCRSPRRARSRARRSSRASSTLQGASPLAVRSPPWRCTRRSADAWRAAARLPRGAPRPRVGRALRGRLRGRRAPIEARRSRRPRRARWRRRCSCTGSCRRARRRRTRRATRPPSRTRSRRVGERRAHHAVLTAPGSFPPGWRCSGG